MDYVIENRERNKLYVTYFCASYNIFCTINFIVYFVCFLLQCLPLYSKYPESFSVPIFKYSYKVNVILNACTVQFNWKQPVSSHLYKN